MCGRFALDAPKAKIEEKFGISLSGYNYKPRLNISPHQGILVVIHDEQSKHKAIPTLWGFIPNWVKEINPAQAPINARLETAATNRYFNYAFKKRRCLIPVTSFYEWDKTTKPKTPYRFYIQGESLFALAGLWSSRLDPEGTELDTSTIITTSANKSVSWLHDRMPLILKEDDWDSWLEGQLNDFKLFPDNELSYEAVSPQINSPKFEPNLAG